MLAMLALASCGPMNAKAPAEQAGTSTNSCAAGLPDSTAEESSPLMLSRKHEYMVYAQLRSPDGSTAPAAHVQKGDYPFVIRVVHGADLQGIGKDAQLTVRYSRKMHNQVVEDYPANATRQDDGTYLTTLKFTKAGHWEVHIELNDGSVQDDHLVKLPK